MRGNGGRSPSPGRPDRRPAHGQTSPLVGAKRADADCIAGLAYGTATVPVEAGVGDLTGRAEGSGHAGCVTRDGGNDAGLARAGREGPGDRMRLRPVSARKSILEVCVSVGSS